jgi:hypothetical protein
VNWGNQLTAMMKVREKRQRHGSELGQPAHCDDEVGRSKETPRQVQVVAYTLM